MKTAKELSFWAFFCQRLYKIDRLIPHLAQQQPNKIHDFRLNVKRINAMLDMLTFRHNHELEVGEVKNLLQPLFKSSGKVRKVSIHHKLLGQVNIPHLDVFKRYLNQKEQQYKQTLINEANTFIYSTNYPLTEIVCDIIHPHKEEGLPICYVQKMQHELDFIFNTHHTDLDAKEWHALRKSVKTTLFLYKIDPCFHDILQFNSGILGRLNSLEKQIGIWHDWVELYDTVIKFLQEYPELITNVNMIRLRYKLKGEMDKWIEPLSRASFQQQAKIKNFT